MILSIRILFLNLLTQLAEWSILFCTVCPWFYYCLIRDIYVIYFSETSTCGLPFAVLYKLLSLWQLYRLLSLCTALFCVDFRWLGNCHFQLLQILWPWCELAVESFSSELHVVLPYWSVEHDDGTTTGGDSIQAFWRSYWSTAYQLIIFIWFSYQRTCILEFRLFSVHIQKLKSTPVVLSCCLSHDSVLGLFVFILVFLNPTFMWFFRNRNSG